jgi:photosystem II stability/assembly factor-like uncharacterized protein
LRKIRNPKSQIRNVHSEIRNLKSEMSIPKSEISNPKCPCGIWQRVGQVAAGGSVLSVQASADGQVWAAAGGSVWACTNKGWQPVPQSRPLPQVSLVAAAGGDWWAAGAAGGLVQTWDGGRSWSACWIDQVAEPIVCCAASPRYAVDRTLLAGTAGAGVLRSTDSGRRWLLSNFGLQEFTILALAVATDWARREMVFAGTLDGVYRSSSGGRAWKPAGLAGIAVQALAASGWFAENGLLLAGTDEAGLYRSADGGRSWQPAGDEIGRGVSINALVGLPSARVRRPLSDLERSPDSAGAAADSPQTAPSERELWLAATGDGQIWRSADGGQTWALSHEAGESILALAAGPDGLYAGTPEGGVLVSTTDGQTWQPDANLCAWGFVRLQATGDRDLWALAPTGGVWHSEDGGRCWKRLLSAAFHAPLIAFSLADDVLLTASPDGLWRRPGGGKPQLVLETPDVPIVALAAGSAGRRVAWAGTGEGALWLSQDAGLTWQPFHSPLRGGEERLIALAASPTDGTPMLGAFSEAGGEITAWRLLGDRWERWLRRPAGQPRFWLAASGPRGDQTWAALRQEVWAHTEAGWQEAGSFEELVGPVVSAGPAGPACVIVGRAIMRHTRASGWTPLPLPPDSSTSPHGEPVEPSGQDTAAPLDLAFTPAGELYCLDAAGVVWRWPA